MTSDNSIGGAQHVAEIGEVKPHPDIKDTLLLKRGSLITELKESDSSISKVQEEYSVKIEQLQMKKKMLGEALHHIEALLRFEGHYVNDNHYIDNETGNSDVGIRTSVTDAAFGLLEEIHKPLHYKDIAAKLLERSGHIPGKNPEATLLSRINRDNRFKRAAKRGVYALSTWRIHKVKPKRAKSRKAKKQQV